MEPEPEPEPESDLTMAEVSFHGSINEPQQLVDDGQDPSSLFKVPKNFLFELIK